MPSQVVRRATAAVLVNAFLRFMSAWQSGLHRSQAPAALQAPTNVLATWPAWMQGASTLTKHLPSVAHCWHCGQRESSHCRREQSSAGRQAG